MDDYDVLEGNYCKLRKARVLLVDYALVRLDFGFSCELSDSEIDAWLIDQFAYLSEGQIQRLHPGGDHHELLGITEVANVVDFTDRKAGIRIRSGGRAATFFVDGEYGFDAEGFPTGRMMDVKGVGTHKCSNHGANPRNTGLLNLADGLREFAIQRLVQRLADLEGQQWGTVRFYGLLDTGLQYKGVNPATGWTNERCVLALRQPSSRAFLSYNGYNFSGVLLMTGEEPPAASVMTGNGRAIRRVLNKYGVSAEFEPRAAYSSSADAREATEVEQEMLADDISGNWNLQSNAPLTHFMDFSDYYVLPTSALAPWRMSHAAFATAFALERPQVLANALADPDLCHKLFGTRDSSEACAAAKKRRCECAQEKRFLDAAVTTKDGEIQPGKPQFCQCWFMEVDDSEVTQWVQAQCHAPDPGPELLAKIDAWLPAAVLQPSHPG
mmetsp:Transcript_83025/g.138757  ORF Transcript_83025/g.138757 Transcript_83025/m.138757 type:complete len:440 (+) Transcript_83025:3-1322(+)